MGLGVKVVCTSADSAVYFPTYSPPINRLLSPHQLTHDCWKIYSNYIMLLFFSLVCVGGDGSLNKIASALLTRTQQDGGVEFEDGDPPRRCCLPIGIIPTGELNPGLHPLGKVKAVCTILQCCDEQRTQHTHCKHLQSSVLTNLLTYLITAYRGRLHFSLLKITLCDVRPWIIKLGRAIQGAIQSRVDSLNNSGSSRNHLFFEVDRYSVNSRRHFRLRPFRVCSNRL